MKLCRECFENKPIDSFRKNHGTCRDCCKQKQAVYRSRNKESILAKNREYFDKNREVILERNRIYRKNNLEKVRAHDRERSKTKKEIAQRFCKDCLDPFSLEVSFQKKYCDTCIKKRNYDSIKRSQKKNAEKISRKQKKYYENNKEKIKQKTKLYSQKHKEILSEKAHDRYIKNKNVILLYHKQYRIKNKDKIQKRRKEYEETIKNNLQIKIRRRVRNAVYCALLRDGYEKGGSILSKLPYSIEDLRLHIESLFEPWMSWDNWGVYDPETWDDNDKNSWTWQIDHIIPQSLLIYDSMDHPNFQVCWALDNLRPYSAKANITEGNKR